ncbi:MAG: hypothetical protein DRO10_00745 [Thermoprotei archaeon]|nr:MAG: hypothetical protein DRO10_00745 [Thermoprotei archaeon]
MSNPAPCEMSEELSEHVLRYGESVYAIVKELKKGIDLVSDMRTGEAMETLANAIKADTFADNLRREILLELREAHGGYVRERVARLVRRLDLVSEYAKEAARDLTLIPFLELPAELKEIIRELSVKVVESVEALYNSLRELINGNTKDALVFSHKVEEIEEETDEVFLKGKRALVKYGEIIHNPAVVYMVISLMQSLENVTDFAEDAGDYIRTLALRGQGG